MQDSGRFIQHQTHQITAMSHELMILRATTRKPTPKALVLVTKSSCSCHKKLLLLSQKDLVNRVLFEL